MATTSNEAMRRGSAQPIGRPGRLRWQPASSGVTPPRRTAERWYAVVVVPGIWPAGTRNAARAVFGWEL